MNRPSEAYNKLNDDLISILFKYWKAIFVFLIISGLSGLYYFHNSTKIYTSKANIYFRNIERPKDAFYLFAQAEFIKTHSVIKKAIQEDGLDNLKTFESISHPPTYITENLTTRVSKKSGIISVSFDSMHQTDAADIVNSILKSYKTFYVIHEQRYLEKTIKFLEEDEADHKLALSQFEEPYHNTPPASFESIYLPTVKTSWYAAEIPFSNLLRIGNLNNNLRETKSLIQVLKTRSRSVPHDIEVIEYAQPSLLPSWPDKERVLVIFLGIGLIIAFTAATTYNRFASLKH